MASTLSLSISRTRGSRLKSNVFEQRSLSCPPLSFLLNVVLFPSSRFCLPPSPLLSSPLLGSLLLSACRYRDGKKAASFQIKTDFKSLAWGSREKHFLRHPSPLPPRLKVSAQGSVDLRGTWNIWQMISGPLSLGYFRVLKSLAAFCLTKLNNVCSSFRFILSLLLLV